VQGRGYGYGGGSIQFGPPVTPLVIKQLLIANVAVFFLQNVSPALTTFGAVRPYQVFREGWIWQPFTYMWLHGGLAHIAFNMFALWMFGSPMALAWGPQKFLRFYLTCGVGAGLVIASWPYLAVALGESPIILHYATLGASGAIFGVLLAYSLTWPDRYLMLLFPPIPIKAIYFIPLLFVLEWMTGPRNVSHVGHLGGVLVGWILLSREGRTRGVLSFSKLKYRWRRWRMRQRLQAVRDEDRRWQERHDRNGRGPLH
jgi:membrane associated rhomboid family serine protease